MKFIKNFKRYPVLIQAFQAGSLMAAGDVVAQFSIEKKSVKDFDVVRPARFFIIGFGLVGPSLNKWYRVLDRLFGLQKTIGAFKKVALDQLIFAPSFLVIFLSVFGLSQQKSLTEIKEQLERDYTDIIISNWMIWPAVQVCNFSLVPLHRQVLVVQSVALFWNTYLAWKTNKGSL